MLEKSTNHPLLSIAIPTYNRINLLDRCLKSITGQIKDPDIVELIVSDNASDIDLKDVVEKYVLEGINIRYIRNDLNYGPDFNIAQCYNAGIGKYVWVIGDDDVILSGGLDRLLRILMTFDPDIVHVRWKAIQDHSCYQEPNEKIYSFANGGIFLKVFTHNITFISSNIIRRKYVSERFHRNLNTNLVQLTFLFEAVLNSKLAILVDNEIIGVEPDNSGGFNVCEVFGKNINNILYEFNRTRPCIGLIKAVNNSLLIECFPFWIRRIRLKINNAFLDSDCKRSLHPIYNKYLFYWLLIYPLLAIKTPFFPLVWQLLKFPRAFLALLSSLRKAYILNFYSREIKI